MRIRIPLAVKFSVIISTVLAIVVLVMLLLIINWQRDNLVIQLQRQAVSGSELVSPLLLDELIRNTPIPLNERVRTFTGRLPETGTIQVFGVSGNVIMTLNPDAASPLVYQDSLMARLLDFHTWIENQSVVIEPDSGLYFWVAAPLVTQGIRLTEKNRFAFTGLVVYSFSSKQVEQSVNEMINDSVRLGGFILVFGIILSIVSASFLKSSFNQLIVAAEEYRKGNYNFRIKNLPADEIGDLIAGVHLMADGIQKAVSNLTEKNEKLNAMTQRATANAESLRFLLDTARDSIIHIDENGIIIFANESFNQLMGNPSAGINWLNLVIAEQRTTHRHWLHDLLSQPEKRGTLQHLTLDLTSNRRILAEVTGNVLKNEAVTRYQLIIRDSSEKHHLQEQLLQARRMESIGRLAGGVAHDFNNLLAIIIPSAELIKMRAVDDRMATQCDSILEASRRASGVVRQLIEFSQQRLAEYRTFHLNDTIRQFHEEASVILGDGVNTELNLTATHDQISGDEDLIRQLFTNLALVARESMAGSGIFSIETRNAEVMKGEKMVSVIHIRVSDSGAGIEEEVLPAVFEPFFGAKRVGEATGLGLAGVYSVVMQHQGMIDVDSSPGKGTVFNIFIPLALEPV